NMIYGPTQAAVGKAIVDGLAVGWISQSAMDDEVVMVQATVHPNALDRHQLYWNAYQAMTEALRNAFVGGC
ncbi:MAG: formaldehyde-activating enzyme, partial [Anaerolineales bacterium]